MTGWLTERVVEVDLVARVGFVVIFVEVEVVL